MNGPGRLSGGKKFLTSRYNNYKFLFKGIDQSAPTYEPPPPEPEPPKVEPPKARTT